MGRGRVGDGRQFRDGISGRGSNGSFVNLLSFVILSQCMSSCYNMCSVALYGSSSSKTAAPAELSVLWHHAWAVKKKSSGPTKHSMACYDSATLALCALFFLLASISPYSPT